VTLALAAARAAGCRRVPQSAMKWLAWSVLMTWALIWFISPWPRRLLATNPTSAPYDIADQPEYVLDAHLFQNTDRDISNRF
jgi:hypothetical protein